MKTIMKLFLMMLITFSTTALFAQALITDQTTPSPAGPDESAILELRSSGFGIRGFLPPRVLMTYNNNNPVPADENFITPTALSDGLIIYNPGGNSNPDDEVSRGLWYYDANAREGQGRWYNYSDASSPFTNSVQNYVEMNERSTNSLGYTTYSLPANQWTVWNSGLVDPVVQGEFFESTPGTGSLLCLEEGIYQVTMSGVFYRISNLTLQVSLFQQESIAYDPQGTSTWGPAEEISKIYGQLKLASAGDAGSIVASGMIQLGQYDKIDLRFKSDAAGSVGLTNLNLTLYKVGGVATNP